MLTNGRITCFNSVSRPTRSRRLFSLRGSFVSYVGRNMLFYPIPQSLGCAPYVARITLARKFINDGCSEECQTKKLLVCCKMFAFFKAIFDIFLQNFKVYHF